MRTQSLEYPSAVITVDDDGCVEVAVSPNFAGGVYLCLVAFRCTLDMATADGVISRDQRNEMERRFKAGLLPELDRLEAEDPRFGDAD